VSLAKDTPLGRDLKKYFTAQSGQGIWRCT